MTGDTNTMSSGHHYAKKEYDNYNDFLDSQPYYYDQNSEEYKRIKKRMQNRESAIRSRMKKKMD
jgi:hypothetical protein